MLNLVNDTSCDVQCDETAGYASDSGTYTCGGDGEDATTALACELNGDDEGICLNVTSSKIGGPFTVSRANSANNYYFLDAASPVELSDGSWTKEARVMNYMGTTELNLRLQYPISLTLSQKRSILNTMYTIPRNRSKQSS